MYEDNTIAVVVPAYNEDGFVGEVLETLPPFVDRAYAVDDHSTDGTWQEIRRASERGREVVVADGGAAPEVVPLRHEENRGVGGAIKTGYLRARDDGMDVVAVMGGDGQMDPDELERIVAPVVEGRADYVKGNRMIRAENHAEMPRFRYVGNRILSLLTKIATGYWGVGDPQMGYTAISREALETVDVEEMYEFYGYCNDLLVRLSAAGMQVHDVPAHLAYGNEESHIRYAEYIPRVSAMLLRMFLWRLAVDRDTPAEQARSTAYVGGGGAAALGTAAALLGRRRGWLVALVGVVGVVAGMVADAVLNRDRTARSGHGAD